MVNHPDSVTYDAFNCNSGKPHEPNTHWDASTNAWEWNDLKVNTGSTPGIFSDDVKEALENNICLICGKKNCPYIKNSKDYQKLTDAIKRGDTAQAKKIYVTRFAQLKGQSAGAVNLGLQKAREARKNGSCSGTYNGAFDSKRIIAVPGGWSEWTELEGFNGSLEHPQPSTINFSPSSNMESSFDVEIKYPEHDKMKTVTTMGPGSYSFTATGAGVSYVRVKSHSAPVTVTVDFPKRN